MMKEPEPRECPFCRGKVTIEARTRHDEEAGNKTYAFIAHDISCILRDEFDTLDADQFQAWNRRMTATPIDERAFDFAIKASKLEYLASIDGNREIIRKLFETYEAAKQPQEVSEGDKRGLVDRIAADDVTRVAEAIELAMLRDRVEYPISYATTEKIARVAIATMGAGPATGNGKQQEDALGSSAPASGQPVEQHRPCWRYCPACGQHQPVTYRQSLPRREVADTVKAMPVRR